MFVDVTCKLCKSLKHFRFHMPMCSPKLCMWKRFSFPHCSQHIESMKKSMEVEVMSWSCIL